MDFSADVERQKMSAEGLISADIFCRSTSAEKSICGPSAAIAALACASASVMQNVGRGADGAVCPNRPGGGHHRPMVYQRHLWPDGGLGVCSSSAFCAFTLPIRAAIRARFFPHRSRSQPAVRPMGPFALTDPAAGTTGPWYTNGTFGLTAGWDLDLWGKPLLRPGSATPSKGAQRWLKAAGGSAPAPLFAHSLWGKNRARIAARIGKVNAQKAELEQTRQLLSTSVARRR
jgi:hypothetical protein